MSAIARTPERARPSARTRWDVAEACLAAAAFGVLCVLVLKAAPYLPKPDVTTGPPRQERWSGDLGIGQPLKVA